MAVFDLREPHTQINTTAQRVKGWSTPPMETTLTTLNHNAVHNKYRDTTFVSSVATTVVRNNIHKHLNNRR
jgi:hypothetical protein